MDPMMPPPVRRIVVDREPYVAPPRPLAATAAAPGRPPASTLQTTRPPAAVVRERMSVESVWLAYGENWVVRDVSLPVRQGEVLGHDRRLGVGQDDAAALAEPAHRDHRGRRAGRAHHARRPGHPRARGQRPAPSRDDGLPAAQPLPDEHLRQRRLRARRAPRARLAPAPAHAARCATPSPKRCAAPASTTRSPTTWTARRCASPAASSSACASRGRWPRTPR